MGYGDPNALEAYKGGRTFDVLQKFAQENLGASCGPRNPELCDEEQKKELAECNAMSSDELKAKITANDEEVAKIDEELGALRKSLQEQFDEVPNKTQQK